MGGRGREGEPIEWTGWVSSTKLVSEANPGSVAVTAGPSARKGAEVIAPHAAKKSLSREMIPPVPQTDTGRQGEISPGDRATLC
jgi:hypothetical protein